MVVLGINSVCEKHDCLVKVRVKRTPVQYHESLKIESGYGVIRSY